MPDRTPQDTDRLQVTRSDLVTARETINRAIAGDEADLEAASGLIDQALEALCPHNPESWFHTTADSGRPLVTCTRCNVSWYTA